MVSANFLGFAGNDDIQVLTALLQLAQQTAAAPVLTEIGPSSCAARGVINFLLFLHTVCSTCCYAASVQAATC